VSAINPRTGKPAGEEKRREEEERSTDRVPQTARESKGRGGKEPRARTRAWRWRREAGIGWRGGGARETALKPGAHAVGSPKARAILCLGALACKLGLVLPLAARAGRAFVGVLAFLIFSSWMCGFRKGCYPFPLEWCTCFQFSLLFLLGAVVRCPSYCEILKLRILIYIGSITF
jgi:hypothetical protein